MKRLAQLRCYCSPAILLLIASAIPAPADAASRTIPCATDAQGNALPFNPDNNYYCTITITDNVDGSEDVRINQPYVNGPFREYKSVVFSPSDLVTITADGCVQTAGEGKTWKRYVNPSGNESGPLQPNGKYYGTVAIKGATTAGGPLQPGLPLYYLTAPLTSPVQIFVPSLRTYPAIPTSS